MPTIHGPPRRVEVLPNGLELFLPYASGNQEFRFAVRFLEEDVVRVAVGDPHTEEKRSWIVVDSTGDVPVEGRPKSDFSRFSCPTVTQRALGSNEFELESRTLVLKVFASGDLRIECSDKEFGVFFADTAFDAYTFGNDGDMFRHSLKRILKTEEYYGFGEPSGPLNKNGMRLRVEAKDAMGYDAETSDPLYKHWPYHLTLLEKQAQHPVCYGLLYDTMRRGIYDLGREISAFRGEYRYFETAKWQRGLDYYLMFGPSPANVSTNLLKVIGRPAIPPRWALGYLGSSMAYTESEDASERLKEFLRLLQEHRIPCDGFHLSSGYTTDAAGRRCVFTWNTKRIPNPRKMFEDFNSQGVNIIANVKPWLLKEHPEFENVQHKGAFFQSASGPSLGRFWVGDAGTSGLGCYLDFSNPQAREWWKQSAKASLLELGCPALWNDNNEFEVDEGEARTAAGDTVDCSGRALHTLLMARASMEALKEHHQTDDVLVITRSGSIGTHRYSAQTWSGDNSTSWKTLKYNIAMCLSLGLSGWPGSGPDVGGFAGERPSQELFLRWVQSGVLMPRFSIHSSVWKTSAEGAKITTNEPWMFPAILPKIRSAIELRYRLMIWLYSLHIQSHLFGAPVAQPLLFHYVNDAQARLQSFEFLLGKDVLVAPPLEPNGGSWQVYFPVGDKWANLDTGSIYYGGNSSAVLIPQSKSTYEFAGAPFFLRAGGGIVLSANVFGSKGENLGMHRRVITLFLNGKGDASVEWFETPCIRCECQVVGSKVVKLEARARDESPEGVKKQRLVADALPFDAAKVTVRAHFAAFGDDGEELDLAFEVVTECKLA